MLMKEMKPLEACIIVDRTSPDFGHTIIRTEEDEKFELIDVTNMSTVYVWVVSLNMKVEKTETKIRNRRLSEMHSFLYNQQFGCSRKNKCK